MKISVKAKPDKKELENLFQRAFSEIAQDDNGYFADNPELNQDNLSDWFDFREFIKYLPNGNLVEARDENNGLIGAGFVGKSHPISWPDGHKAELFIIGVLPGTENRGTGTALLKACEDEARRFGAESIITNAHSQLPKTLNFYIKNGYRKIGELKDYYANGNAVFFKKELI